MLIRVNQSGVSVFFPTTVNLRHNATRDLNCIIAIPTVPARLHRTLMATCRGISFFVNAPTWIYGSTLLVLHCPITKKCRAPSEYGRWFKMAFRAKVIKRLMGWSGAIEVHIGPGQMMTIYTPGSDSCIDLIFSLFPVLRLMVLI